MVYDADDQTALQAAGPVLTLAGRYSLGEFCELIDGLDLFPVAPQRGEVQPPVPAVDVSQRGAGPGAAPGGHASVHRCWSASLGRSPSSSPCAWASRRRWRRSSSRLANYPSLRFKLDATSSWTPELIAALVAAGAVDSIDFKALYQGTIVDQEPDPALYARVVEAFPHAWLEDPDVVTEGTASALAAEHDRITWDAPIHSIADIEALPFRPRMVNIKPSRIGGLSRLCDTYDYCAEHGVGAYGGGQFELGPGRGQAQYLASLFHPDTPNDLAPSRLQ